MARLRPAIGAARRSVERTPLKGLHNVPIARQGVVDLCPFSFCNGDVEYTVCNGVEMGIGNGLGVHTLQWVRCGTPAMRFFGE